MRSVKKIAAIAGTLIGCFAVFGQLYLILINAGKSDTSYLSEIIRFLSFMTIQTNILVTVTFLTSFRFTQTSVGKFLQLPSVQTAVFVYIFVVGISYHFLLADIWDPQGWQNIIDKTLHYIVPAYYYLFWMLLVHKHKQPITNAFRWLIYPIVYFIYSLVRGIIADVYPYPFIDVNELGYMLVLRNVLGLLVCYLILSSILLFVNNFLLTKDS